MKKEHIQYWLWAIGIGVVVFIWWNSNKSTPAAVQTTAGGQGTFLVPQTLSGNNAPLSEQSNIVGSSPSQNVPNGTNFSPSSSNPTETPNSWAMMPNLIIVSPQGATGNLSSAPTGSTVPFYSYVVPNGTWNPVA